MYPTPRMAFDGPNDDGNVASTDLKRTATESVPTRTDLNFTFGKSKVNVVVESKNANRGLIEGRVQDLLSSMSWIRVIDTQLSARADHEKLRQAGVVGIGEQQIQKGPEIPFNRSQLIDQLRTAKTQLQGWGVVQIWRQEKGVPDENVLATAAQLVGDK